MQELDEFLRLRKCGVSRDYYLMDAFWYDPDGTFMKWRKPHGKNGPGRWLKKCLDNDVKRMQSRRSACIRAVAP